MTATANDILERIHLDPEGAIRLFQRSGVEMGVLRELAANNIAEEGVQLFLASMPNTPSRILEALLKSNSDAVLRQLALNPAFLPKMLECPEERVRIIAASCRRLSMPAAMQLASDKSLAVRLTLAHNSSIAPNIQLKLSQDEVQFVRMALLENSHLDEEFQIGLGDDRDTIVHVSTILTPRLSHACMKIWAEFDEELGQLALAGRDDLPEDILAILAKSHYTSVRLQLLRYQKLPSDSQNEFSAAADAEMAAALLRRTDLAPEAVKALWDAHHDNLHFCQLIAKSAALTDEVALELLARASSNDALLLQAVALNLSENLTETRLQLARLGNAGIHKVMLANPMCRRPDIVSAIVEHCVDEVLPHIAYREISCEELSEKAKERIRQYIHRT